jgi:hypothetical protein
MKLIFPLGGKRATWESSCLMMVTNGPLELGLGKFSMFIGHVYTYNTCINYCLLYVSIITVQT